MMRILLMLCALGAMGAVFARPTFNQAERLIGAVQEAGGDSGAYTASLRRVSSVYSSPTFSQFERLIGEIRSLGGAMSNAVEVEEAVSEVQASVVSLDSVKADKVALAEVVADVASLEESKADKEERPYAMFVIDLNPDGIAEWQHIELKATVSNFSANDTTNMPFFCGSSANREDTYGTSGFKHDWCRIYIPGGDGSDVRRWTEVESTYTAAVSNITIGTMVVIVDSEGFRRSQGSAWLRDDNDELIWSYVRIGDDRAELNTDGRQLWRAVMPVRWYSRIPDWADQL